MSRRKKYAEPVTARTTPTAQRERNLRRAVARQRRLERGGRLS